MKTELYIFSLWWKEVDDENAKRLMANSGDYKYYLEAIRLYKPHTLSEPEEKDYEHQEHHWLKCFNKFI
ncbi:MAG: putative M3 family peptidase [Chloroflexi bacterium OLB14]|nr:MAG: putative M3 family peptidase [Chloroflexi bacterium OLB14]